MSGEPRVRALIDALIEREGGFVDHPADRGGPTTYGITLAALHEWRNRPVDRLEIALLGVDEARAIYRNRYFDKPGFGAITDPELQEFLFDFAVNSGPDAAIRALQTALRDMDLYRGAIDGILGPQSRAALQACNNFPELFYRTKCERYELMLRFIGRDARQAVFAAGWANRLDGLQDRRGEDARLKDARAENVHAGDARAENARAENARAENARAENAP